MPKKKSLAPQQSRSRESLAKLMRAATAILQEKGLEGATIPRIAARAGLSPGSVYRRFPDKDALMRKVLIAVLESIDIQTASVLTPELAEKCTLPGFIEKLVRQNLASYRKNTRLLSAITQFFRTHPSAAFRQQVDEIETRTFRRMVQFLMHYREDIRHPDPEAALAFSLLVFVFSLREIVLMEVITDVWKPLLPKDDNALVHEFTGMILRHLGVERDGAEPHSERSDQKTKSPGKPGLVN